MGWHGKNGGKNNKCWKGKSDKPGKRSWYKTKQDDEGDNDFERRQLESVHEGSIPIDQVKNSDDWKNHIDQSNCPKGKYAVCFAYLGTEYQGLQINPGARSIESMMERAMLLSGAIQEENYGNLQKIGWTRAARTDKGVHAIANCCGMKLKMPIGGESLQRTRINSFLPSDIRIIAITKTTKSFNAKNKCTRRRYEFLLPTYTLQLVSTMNEYLKEAKQKQGNIRDAGKPGGYGDPTSLDHLAAPALSSVRTNLVSYRASEETLEKLKETWKSFEGTRRYHNFTSDKSPYDESAKRFMMNCTCSDPIIAFTGVQFVKLTVIGQSFLLNQIRKMVGVTVDVVRGAASSEVLEACFSPDYKVTVPMVPGVGLYLGELYFDSYNDKLVNDETFALVKRVGVEETEKEERVREEEEEREKEKERMSHTETVEMKKENECEEEKKEEKVDTSFSRADQLNWSSDPLLHEEIENFRSDVLWPHIFREEEKSLPFMYYLDFLRIVPHDYTLNPYK